MNPFKTYICVVDIVESSVFKLSKNPNPLKFDGRLDVLVVDEVF